MDGQLSFLPGEVPPDIRAQKVAAAITSYYTKTGSWDPPKDPTICDYVVPKIGVRTLVTWRNKLGKDLIPIAPDRYWRPPWAAATTQPIDVRGDLSLSALPPTPSEVRALTSALQYRFDERSMAKMTVVVHFDENGDPVDADYHVEFHRRV